MSKIKNKFSIFFLLLAVAAIAASAFLLPSGYVQSRVIYPAVSWVNFNTLHYGTFLGYQTGLFNSGDYNSFIGYRAGYSNTTGANNSFIGKNAGMSNATGSHNIALGTDALTLNTNGYRNVAIGSGSMWENISGYENIAIGSATLQNTTSSNSNIAIGTSALNLNISGNNNAAVGTNALYWNSTASNNSAMGMQALFYNETGGNNSGFGTRALYGNTTGGNNSGFGYFAGNLISGGAIDNATSTNSLYLGYDTRALSSGDDNEIVIGANTTGAGSNSATLGNASITKTILRNKVGINQTSPDYDLDVNGTLRVVNSTILATTTVTDITATGLSKVSVYLSTNQTVTSSQNTTMKFDTVVFDALNEFSTSTHRFTALKSGYYHVDAQLMYISPIADKRYSIIIYRNSTSMSDRTLHASWASYLGVTTSKTFYMTAGQYVEIQTYNDSTDPNEEILSGESTTFMTIYRLP